MNLPFLITAAIFILTAIYFFISKKRKNGKQHALWEEGRQKLRLPSDMADETIERLVERLKKRYPDHSEEWYLQKMIYDLERDRR